MRFLRASTQPPQLGIFKYNNASELGIFSVQHVELLRPSPSTCDFSDRSPSVFHRFFRAWFTSATLASTSVVPPLHAHPQLNNKQKQGVGYTYFLLAICAAVAAFGLSSMAAFPESQLPYRSSPPCPSAPLLLILLFQQASAAFVASFANGKYQSAILV